MSDFRRGDRRVVVAGQNYRLRLSLAALADIADLFAAESPAELAAWMRAAAPEDWSGIFAALAHPRPAEAISPDALAPVLPDIAAVIAEGLVP